MTMTREESPVTETGRNHWETLRRTGQFAVTHYTPEQEQAWDEYVAGTRVESDPKNESSEQ